MLLFDVINYILLEFIVQPITVYTHAGKIAVSGKDVLGEWYF